MNLVEKAHREIESFIRNRSGLLAVDATCGNGRDTLELARMGCRVFAFDVQQQAINATRNLLEDNSLASSVTLFKQSHATMSEAVPTQAHGKVKIATFNLGWLPLSDKNIITKSETTIDALKALAALVDKKENLVSVLAYRGHIGGEREYRAVNDFLRPYKPNIFGNTGNPRSPTLFVFSL